MEQEYITRAEHEEYALRMDQEHKRTNHRLETLEQTTQEINRLQLSIERLAVSVESMVKEQRQQSDRLQVLEGRDGTMWRQTVGYIISAVIGAAATYIIGSMV